MLDAYYIGDVTRISPEAPVPIVSVTNKERRLGGAANVAFNIKELGGNAVICSVRGNDIEGEWIHNHLEELGLDNSGLFIDYNRPTTVKTRIIGNKHQVLRVDQEDCTPVDTQVEKQVIDFVKKRINDIDVVVFQDYNKGLLTQKVINGVISLCNKADIPSLVDPKKDHFLDFKGVTLFKPNRKEIIEGLKLSYELTSKTEIESALRLLAKKLNTQNVLLTLSEMGVAIYSEGEVEYIPAHKRKIIDVSGAGDSVISVAALAVGLKKDWSFVAKISNLAGGLVCEKVGVVPVDKEQLKSEVKRLMSQQPN
ncbi:MAG: D-glycero-beta-D-manno-heptose-7-phosphate kinase [Bacteroidia bacterium]|nr:D-glycero-beta-D-manno-heptose-7-phosphate kinase [Bacteroidia bacterium]